MLGKLFLYDSSDWINRSQAGMRNLKSNEVIPADSKDTLHAGLASLLKQQKFFDRVLFQTHGDPHAIWFGDYPIFASTWRLDFKNKYYKLFPSHTKVVFDGCETAQGERGTKFLEAAGEVFCLIGGGEVLGYEGSGLAMPSPVPFVGGHTIYNPARAAKIILFLPGAIKKSVLPVMPDRSWTTSYANSRSEND
jgi:hypothetical protein